MLPLGGGVRRSCLKEGCYPSNLKGVSCIEVIKTRASTNKFGQALFVLEDDCGLQNWACMMGMKEAKSQDRYHLAVVLEEAPLNVGR